MNPVFPPEIIKNSIERHFSQFSQKSVIIYLFVLLTFVAAIISLFFVKTEITVQSRGILRSSQEPIPLVSPVIAKINRIVLNENKFVSQGDTLIWLDCDKLSERIAHLNNLIHENESYLSDIDKMLEYRYFDLQTDLFQSTHASYRQKLAEFELNIEIQEKLFSRAKLLFEKQVIPVAEMEEQQFALEKIRKERKNFIQFSRNEWENLAVSYRLENKKYWNEIFNLRNEKKNYFISAPESGYITHYSGIKVGSFVTTGEKIADISPEGQIIAEQLVPPKDIGYLKPGMPVIFQVDAYNYNQWGLATGIVREISNEVYLVNNQPFFRVRSSIDQTFLELGNGYKGELRKGLTFTARFKVTQRTLAQLIFDKTDDWLNPKIISE